MTAQKALQQIDLTGSGTRDSLTVDLQDGQQVTLNRELMIPRSSAPFFMTVDRNYSRGKIT